MKPVAQLVIEMAANVARLEKDMARARNSVDGAMRKIQASVRVAMRALGALGLGLGAAQLVGFVRSAINAGDQMVKLSQQVGIATQNIAGLQLSFRQGGVNASEMSMAMARLVDGMSKQTVAYKKLNLTSTDTLGALSEVADIFQKMPDGAEKSAMAYELFGRSGMKLIPVLNQGAAGLQSYIDLSQKLGMVVSDDVGKQFELYNDTLDTVSAAMEGLANQAAIAIIPALQSVADALLSAFTSGSVQRGIDTMIEAVKILGIVLAGKLIASIAAMAGGLVTMAAGMTAATAATGGLTIALSAMRGVVALMGGPIGLIATAATALVYFTEKAYAAETTVDGLSKSLGVTNAELINMTKIQIEQKIVDVALELQNLEMQLLKAALAQDALNQAMSDPEAYAFEGGKISTEMNNVNKRSVALFSILERLKDQLVDVGNESTSAGSGLGELGNSASKTTDKIAELIEKYRQETDALIMSNDEKERAAFTQAMLNEGVKKGTAAYKEYLDLFDVARVERLTLQSQIKSIELEKKANEERLAERVRQEEEFATEAQRINDQIGQSLTDALVNGGVTAKDFIVNMFKTLILRPILQPIISGTLAAFGIGAAGASMAGVPGGTAAAGGMDAFGLLSAAKSAYDVLSGGFAAVGNAASSFASSLLGADAAATAFMVGTGEASLGAAAALESIGATAATVGAAANVLAGVAAGLAAGTFISGEYSLFGDQMVATAIGTAIGLALGGPVGAAIGGAVGGLVNRAFGQGPRESQAAGITGTLTPMGADLQAFTDWSRKGGWFRSGSSGTDFSVLDPVIGDFLAQQTRSIGFAVAVLAESLGESSARIGDFSQQIKIDLLNLSDEEAQEKINEALGDFSDKLVDFLVPAIQSMTKAGETSSEALSRLSSSLSTVNLLFGTLGIKIYDLSLNSAQAASNLVDLTGGVDAFTQKTDFIYQNFYDQQERVSNATSQAAQVFEALGLAMPSTREGFRQLFDVIAGSGSASLTAAMLNIAPIMNDLIGYTEQLTEAESKRLEQIRNEGLGLEKQMLELLKDTVELRRLELLTLDESNRALQISLFGVADAQFSASRAASETNKSFSDLKDVIASQLSLALTNLQTNFDLLTVSINNQITATQVAKAIANENLNSLNQIFSTLSTNIIGILGDVQSMQTAKQGFAFITNALTSAQNTGYMPDNDQLSQAVGAARSGLGSSNFSSAFEQQKAILVLANQLIQLRGIAGDQMSTAERQVELAEKLLDAFNQRIRQADLIHNLESDLTKWVFDKQSQYADNQLNSIVALRAAMYNVDGSINTNFEEDAKRIESQMALDKFLFDQQIAYAGFNIDEIKNVKSAIFGSSSNQMDWLKNIEAVLFNLDGSINLSNADQINELAKLGSTVVGGIGLNIDNASDKTFVQFLQTLKAQGLISDEQLKYAERQIGSIFGVENSVFDVETAIQALKGDLNNNFGVENAVYTVRDAINLLAVNINSERGSLNAVLSSLVALQQDTNARAVAEEQRLERERQLAIERADAEDKALEDARLRAKERADAEAAQAEVDRLAREKATADEAKRRADAAEAERLRNVDRTRLFTNFLVGGSFFAPGNARGGRFQGGLSLVGEEGPELVNFARPSMIYTAGETSEILNGGAQKADMGSEIRQLRNDNRLQNRAMVSLQNRMTRILEQWDGDGLPTERYEGATT